MLSAIVCFLVAVLLQRAARRHPRVVYASLGTLMIAMAASQAVMTRHSLRQSAFRSAFGTDPTSDVRALRVSREYAGGPGDSLTTLSFYADNAVVQRLIGDMSEPWDAEIALRDFIHDKASSDRLWRDFLKQSTGRGEERLPTGLPVLQEPRILHRPADRNEMPPKSVRVLWDRKTGFVYVIKTAG
jgi:hypothetical protein